MTAVLKVRAVFEQVNNEITVIFGFSILLTIFLHNISAVLVKALIIPCNYVLNHILIEFGRLL